MNKINPLQTMTPRERVFARLEGKPVDRIPNLSIIMTFAAKRIGVSYDQFVQDYCLLVEGNLRCCEEFEIDMLSAISDPMREAQALGAEVIFPEDGVPYAAIPLIVNPSDINNIKVRQPISEDRLFDRIKAIEDFKRIAGDQYPILGWVEGAFAEVCDLHGISETMADLLDRPEFIEELLEICTSQAILFAEAQINAGADFIGIGDAAASLISGRMYRKFVLPYEKRIIESIHAMGAKAKLHICGNINALLNLIPESGADIVDVDYPVNFETAINALGGSISACGNFEPARIMLLGTVEEVQSAVRECTSVANSRTMIAPGCEVPRDTPLDNMKAVSHILWKLST